MPRISIEAFKALKPEAQPEATVAKDMIGEVTFDDSARTATFVYSDGSIDRYGDTINPKGWELDNYRSNPIALFGHDANSVENVIGRSTSVEMRDGALVGTIEFMSGDINPTAETVYQMVKAGFLNCVSVGFRPLDYRAASDKNRKGGIDFLRQELLEISVVPVPALPSAVVQAKGWDATQLRSLGIQVEEEKPMLKLKSLYHVSWLASLLGDLACVEDSLEWEKGTDAPAVQQLVDAMKVLGECLVNLTAAEVQALIAAEAEEAATGEDADSMMQLAVPKAMLQALTFLRSAKRDAVAASLLLKTFEYHLNGEKVSISRKAAEPIQLAKAGRVLSKENQATLQCAYDTHVAACEKLKSVIDKVAADDADATSTCSAAATAEREMRARKARAAAALLSTTNA